VCKLGFFWHERFKCPQVPKKAQFTQERVEYNDFFVQRAPNRLKSVKMAEKNKMGDVI
jgi:hypothetical protein